MSSSLALGALGIRERQLVVVRELADSLALAQANLLASDLENFERQTMWQEQLCGELSSLQAELAPKQRGSTAWGDTANSPNAHGLPEGDPDSAAQQRWSAQEQELVEAQAQVCQQARVYAALLRRARRTVEIFCRVLASSGVTYAVPSSSR